MPLYALDDSGQPVRALEDGPRRASCAECGAPMRARAGSVRIWHWAHLVHNPHCEAARESEWHLAWKLLGIDGTQEIVVGNRRADVLAPGGYAVEFQASALAVEEVRAREEDWAGHSGMAWVFRADKQFASGTVEVRESFADYEKHLVKAENRATLDIIWRWAPEHAFAARAPSFLDIGGGELLFVGGWRRPSSPRAGYGWRVSKDWVVQNLLRGSTVPVPFAEDPEEIRRKIEAWKRKEAERERAARWRQLAKQQAERERERGHHEEAVRRQEEIRARRTRLTQQYLARTGQMPEPESAQDPPAPGFVISDRLREWRLDREAKRAGEEHGEISGDRGAGNLSLPPLNCGFGPCFYRRRLAGQPGCGAGRLRGIRGMSVLIWMAGLAYVAGIVLALPVPPAGWTGLAGKAGVRGRYHGRHVKGAAPAEPEPADAAPQPDARLSCQRRRPWRLARVVCRVDVGILVVATITGIITYLILLKTH